MKFEYSRMELELDRDATSHEVEILEELNRLGIDSWLLVSAISFCDTGRGTEICSAIIVRTIPSDDKT